MKVITRQLLCDILNLHKGENQPSFITSINQDILNRAWSGPFVQVDDLVFAQMINHFTGSSIGERLCDMRSNQINRNGTNAHYLDYNEMLSSEGERRWLDSQLLKGKVC